MDVLCLQIIRCSDYKRPQSSVCIHIDNSTSTLHSGSNQASVELAGAMRRMTIADYLQGKVTYTAQCYLACAWNGTN
jgi:hypothetical protein